jgi:hypothetical protein
LVRRALANSRSIVSVGAVGQLPRDAVDPCGAHAGGERGSAIVVAQDTTEINFAGREANRRGLGAAGDGVSAGFFIHPLLAIDSETEAVLGLLDAQIWTRDDAIEAAPRRQRAIEDKESMRWLRGVERAGELLADAASVVVVGDRESDIYSCFARRPAGVNLIVRAAQDRAIELAPDGPVVAGSLFASALHACSSWPWSAWRRRAEPSNWSKDRAGSSVLSLMPSPPTPTAYSQSMISSRSPTKA